MRWDYLTIEPHPRARLEAVAELDRAGIPTGVLIAPLMPGINDAPEQLEPLLVRRHLSGLVRHDELPPASRYRRSNAGARGADGRRGGGAEARADQISLF